MKSLKQLMDLRQRVALVTGGAGHIGAALGEALAELGANVAVLDFSADACAETAKRLQDAYGVATLPLVVNLADEKQLRTVPSIVLERFGRLDILVHCASLVGTSPLKGWVTPFEQQSAETWRMAMDVNLTAPFILTQAFSPALVASGNGSVINVASTYGVVGPDMRLYDGTSMGNPAAYSASKGGLLQFTRWLATVLAPNVRANAISPGGVQRNQPDCFQERYIERTPLRRMACEEDFKGAVAYLASDLSRYVTGQNLLVDGGWSTW